MYYYKVASVLCGVLYKLAIPTMNGYNIINAAMY